MLLDFDYSQIEPRIMAHLSGDKRLSEIFHSGKDLYDGVTEALNLCVCKEHRRLAKILWLAIAYNAGAFKISKTAGITFNKAQKFLELMRASFPELFYWKDKTIKQAEVNGYVITMFGRKIPLPLEFAHLAPNYKVQGSAAEINKLAMIHTRQFSPVITVHDEILFDLPDDSQLNEIKSLMENVVELRVPIKVEAGTGNSWKESKN